MRVEGCALEVVLSAIPLEARTSLDELAYGSVSRLV